MTKGLFHVACANSKRKRLNRVTPWGTAIVRSDWELTVLVFPYIWVCAPVQCNTAFFIFCWKAGHKTYFKVALFFKRGNKVTCKYFNFQESAGRFPISKCDATLWFCDYISMEAKSRQMVGSRCRYFTLILNYSDGSKMEVRSKVTFSMWKWAMS